MKALLRAAAGLLAAGFVVLVGQVAYAGDDCTSQERTTADAWLKLNSRDQALAVAEHLPWGAPHPATPPKREAALIQRDYVIQYDGELRVPIWSAEHVVANKIGQMGRSDCFRTDHRLKADAASTKADYEEKIFDMGHLSPSADFTSERMAVHNSFVMSNMTPQFCQFNRGVWQILEELARLWAKEHGEAYILNGSVFDRDGDGVRDANDAALRMTSSNGKKRVAIPSAFYKVVAYRQPNGRLATLAVMMPNDQTDLAGDAAFAYLGAHVVRLARIESVTGLDLFPEGGATIDEATALWSLAPGSRRPTSLVKPGQCPATAGAYVQDGTYVLPQHP